MVIIVATILLAITQKSNAFRLANSASRLCSLSSLGARERSGGDDIPVYQYTGPGASSRKGPPSGIRDLPGTPNRKIRTDSDYKSRNNNRRSSEGRKDTDDGPKFLSKPEKLKKKGLKNKDDDLEYLEKSVIAKYGSNEFKNQFLEELEEEKKANVWSERQGFYSPIVNKGKKTSTPTGFGSNEDILNNVEDSSGKPSLLQRLKSRKVSRESMDQQDQNTADSAATSSEFDDLDEFLEEMGESDFKLDDVDEEYSKKTTKAPDAPTYRLRRPPPVDPSVAAKEEEKRVMKEAKEAERIEKNKAKRAADKHNFSPFTFDDNEDEVSVHDELFTSKGFNDLGIKDPTILANLEKMGFLNPTKIQELAIPTMLAGNDVVMQAQTGSGKTLAYLLSLLGTVDPTKNKVIMSW